MESKIIVARDVKPGYSLMPHHHVVESVEERPIGGEVFIEIRCYDQRPVLYSPGREVAIEAVSLA